MVDDGSTDGTQEYLKSLGNRITILSQPNRGPGAARNLGARSAQGEYLAFLDSDDLWFPWTLETYRDVLASVGSIGFVSSAHISFERPSDLCSIVYRDISVRRYSDYFASARDAVWIPGCGVVVPRQLFALAYGFTERHVNGEDSDLWLKLGIAGEFVMIESPPLWGYRQTPGSAVSTRNRTVNGMKLLIATEKSGAYPGGASRARERITIITGHVRPVAVACVREWRIREALALYFSCLTWHLRLHRWRFLVGFWWEVVHAMIGLKFR